VNEQNCFVLDEYYKDRDGSIRMRTNVIHGEAGIDAPFEGECDRGVPVQTK